jgi:hypothetical protein
VLDDQRPLKADIAVGHSGTLHNGVEPRDLAPKASNFFLDGSHCRTMHAQRRPVCILSCSYRSIEGRAFGQPIAPLHLFQDSNANPTVRGISSRWRPVISPSGEFAQTVRVVIPKNQLRKSFRGSRIRGLPSAARPGERACKVRS